MCPREVKTQRRARTRTRTRTHKHTHTHTYIHTPTHPTAPHPHADTRNPNHHPYMWALTRSPRRNGGLQASPTCGHPQTEPPPKCARAHAAPNESGPSKVNFTCWALTNTRRRSPRRKKKTPLGVWSVAEEAATHHRATHPNPMSALQWAAEWRRVVSTIRAPKCKGEWRFFFP